jgi:hypothetical protein
VVITIIEISVAANTVVAEPTCSKPLQSKPTPDHDNRISRSLGVCSLPLVFVMVVYSVSSFSKLSTEYYYCLCWDWC